MSDDHDAPDLKTVEETIREARESEEHLETVMPSAIQPDDEAYQGMSGPTEGDVEQTDDDVRTDDTRQAESSQDTPTEQVEEAVVEEAVVEEAVVEDDSQPPGDPDHR